MYHPLMLNARLRPVGVFSGVRHCWWYIHGRWYHRLYAIHSRKRLQESRTRKAELSRTGLANIFS